MKSSSTSNPFDSDDEGNNNNKTTGGTTTSAASASAVASASAAVSSASPFDFDVDFSAVQKRRDRARAAKQEAITTTATSSSLLSSSGAGIGGGVGGVVGSVSKEDAMQSLVGNMDTAMNEQQQQQQQSGGEQQGTTSGDGGLDNKSGHGNNKTGGGNRRPNIIPRSRMGIDGSQQTSTQNQNQGLGPGGRLKTSFFGFGKDNSGTTSDILGDDELEYSNRDPFRVGSRTVAVWPYDDYHVIQKLYYEKLIERQEMGDGDDQDEKMDDHVRSSKAKKKQQKQLQQQPQPTPVILNTTNSSTLLNDPTTTQSSIPVFRRPADPPDITSAVVGLPLTEFERKAEERAIAIVSTWLFDAGLIDELLVNGGMSNLGGMNLFSTGGGGSIGGGPNDHDPDGGRTSSSEGIEVGSHGFPIEGSTKMDKEIAKLRNSTKRQLALINARLNDGVAATGAEVQELVNAVIATKDDLGRLRELSTYVSNAADVEASSQFMLTKYPKLKQAINARRNLARCFRELDFFSQIPSTCDRLREELHAGEWTAHEWSTLRSVCREHVELEIFLVEAEAGMKKRLEEEALEAGHSGSSHHNAGSSLDRRSATRRASSVFGRQAFVESGLRSNTKNELIDRFLEEHVENVWELGDEIRLRILSGIATAFDLAMNNPAGMVALVEAVEVYETANEEYRTVHGEEAGTNSQTLRFTDMRAAALGALYKDFESRGLDVFGELTAQAADVVQSEGGGGAEETAAANQQFSAVLRAANELASEIGIVKEQMAPCFPPNWAIETIWTVCVAHVCSTNILQQIGGPDGQKLPDLTVTQLLDLVAWVENFREIIEETFPTVATITSKKTYFDQPPKLLADDSKTVDIEVAKDSLAWVINTLWEVHDLAKDEFLYRTKEQTEEWLENVYAAEHTKSQTAEGRLVTSLCEDVYALAGVQLRTIRERLTRKSEALVQAVGVILKNLYEKQIASRDMFCTDFETCCAAANDFIRMSEKCEEVVGEIQNECILSKVATEVLEEQSAAILGLYSSDAVYAAQKTHIYCFEPIEEAIVTELFGEEWEVSLTHNELMLTLVRTLDDFMEDLESFLDEVMVQKAVEAQITSSVNFYIRCLLKKASEHKSNRDSAFNSNEKAFERMRGDIVVMREYFDGLAENMPTLTRVIETEFSFLEAVMEIMSIAVGVSHSDAHDFILILQKRVRNVNITKFVVGDLYHLVKPTDETSIYEMIETMEDEMSAVAPNDERAAVLAAQDRNAVPGLRIDEILATHCDESQRNRPLKAGAMDVAKRAFGTWKRSAKHE